MEGAGSTRDRLLKTLREREGRSGRIDMLVLGGKVDLSGRVGKIVRRILAGVDSDQVVELSSTTPRLFDHSRRVTTACNPLRILQGRASELATFFACVALPDPVIG